MKVVEERVALFRDTFIIYFLHKKYDKSTVSTFFYLYRNVVIIIISFDLSNCIADDLIGRNVSNY